MNISASKAVLRGFLKSKGYNPGNMSNEVLANKTIAELSKLHTLQIGAMSLNIGIIISVSDGVYRFSEVEHGEFNAKTLIKGLAKLIEELHT